MEAEKKRINDVAADLSFCIIPRDSMDWMYQPSLRLLTEEESEGLVAVFEKLEDVDADSPMLPLAMARLKSDDLDLLETFIRKSDEGMARKKSAGFHTVFQMNMAESRRQG